MVSQADLLPTQEAQEPSRSRWPWRRPAPRARGTTAGELMTSPAITVGPDATVVDAAKLLDRHGIKRLPVVDRNGRLVGIVSRRDLLTVFLREDEDLAADIADRGSDRLIDALVLHGAPETIAAGLTAHLEAGADHVGVQVLADPGHDPTPGYRQLAEALSLKPR